MPRDSSYDTHEEAEMDNDEAIMRRASAKVAAEKRKCQCGTQATIKTTYDRDGVAYHCSELCYQWWLRNATRKPATIDKTERSAEGWGK